MRSYEEGAAWVLRRVYPSRYGKIRKGGKGRREKLTEERGEAQSKTLRFRLNLGTEEESPLTEISCITVVGLVKACLVFG